MSSISPVGRLGFSLPAGRRATSPVTWRTYSLRSPCATDSSRMTTCATPEASRRSMNAAFIDLRGASGVAPVVIRDESVAHGLRSEYVLQVTGEVARRPAGNENPNLPTGEIELIARAVVVLNEAAPLPFQIDEHVEVGEEARLKYRYLDLRRSGPSAALRLRSKVSATARLFADLDM